MTDGHPALGHRPAGSGQQFLRLGRDEDAHPLSPRPWSVRLCWGWCRPQARGTADSAAPVAPWWLGRPGELARCRGRFMPGTPPAVLLHLGRSGRQGVSTDGVSEEGCPLNTPNNAPRALRGRWSDRRSGYFHSLHREQGQGQHVPLSPLPHKTGTSHPLDCLAPESWGDQEGRAEETGVGGPSQGAWRGTQRVLLGCRFPWHPGEVTQLPEETPGTPRSDRPSLPRAPTFLNWGVGHPQNSGHTWSPVTQGRILDWTHANINLAQHTLPGGRSGSESPSQDRLPGNQAQVTAGGRAGAQAGTRTGLPVIPAVQGRRRGDAVNPQPLAQFRGWSPQFIGLATPLLCFPPEKPPERLPCRVYAPLLSLASAPPPDAPSRQQHPPRC